jgi:hypothetical protein
LQSFKELVKVFALFVGEQKFQRVLFVLQEFDIDGLVTVA